MNTTTNENSNAPKTGLITAILVAIYAAVLLLMLSSKTLTANAKEEEYAISYNVYYDQYGTDGKRDTYGTVSLAGNVCQGYTAYAYAQSDKDCSDYAQFSLCLVNDETGAIIDYYDSAFDTYFTNVTTTYNIFFDNGDQCINRTDSCYNIGGYIFRDNKDHYGKEVYWCENVAYTANFSIFESKEALIAYLTTGDDSGQINKPTTEIPNSSINGVYDETIGHVQNLQIDTVTAPECHGASDSFLNCFVLSWDIPATNKNEYTEYYETKINMQYSYLTGLSTSRKYGSQFVDYNVNGSILCILSSEGTHAFCAHEFYEFTNLKETYSGLNYVLSFYIKDVTKIYMRPVRVSNTDSAISYGDWTVFDVDFSRGILNDRVVTGGTIYPGDSTINPDGSIDNEPSGTIEPTDTENSFSFAGIDLTDIKNIGAYFIGLLETLVNMIGYFPTLFSRVYSFLPSEIINMIYCGFVVVFVTGLFKIFT